MEYRKLVSDERFKTASIEDRKRFRSNYFKKFIGEETPENIEKYGNRLDEIEREEVGSSVNDNQDPMPFGLPNPVDALRKADPAYMAEVDDTVKSNEQNIIKSQNDMRAAEQREVDKLNGTFLGDIIAGVDQGIVPKAVKWMQGGKGLVPDAQRTETPSYGRDYKESISNILHNEQLGDMSARQALVHDLLFGAGKLAADAPLLAGGGAGTNKIVQGLASKVLAKSVAGGLNFGAYGAMDKATSFGSGAETSETPVMDVLKTAGKNAAVGAVLPFVEPLVNFGSALSRQAVKVPLSVTAKVASISEKGANYVTKAEKVSNAIKDSIVGKTAEKVISAVDKGVAITAEDYTMLGLQNKLDGKNFTDVTFKDMVQNTPLSIAMHVSNKMSSKNLESDGVSEAFKIWNEKNKGTLDFLDDVAPDPKHSKEFAKELARDVHKYAMRKKDIIDSKNEPVRDEAGKKVKQYDRTKTLENILEYADMHREKFQKMANDPVAKATFEASLNGHLQQVKYGGGIQVFKGMSLKDYHDAIVERSKGRADEIYEIDKKINDLSQEWQEIYNGDRDPMTGLRTDTWMDSFEIVMDKVAEIEQLKKQKQEIEGTIGPIIKSDSKLTPLKSGKAETAYEKYVKRTDYARTEKLVDTAQRMPAEVTAPIKKMLSMDDAQVNEIVKRANKADVDTPDSTFQKLKHETKLYLMNGGRFIFRQLGEEFGRAVVTPMRKAEEARNIEDTINRAELLKFAKKLTKEQRVLTTLYLLDRQGGDASATARKMLADGQVEISFFKRKYEGDMPTREDIDALGAGEWVDYIDAKMADYKERLMATRDIMGLGDIEWIDNYFSLIRNVDNMKDFDLDFILKGNERIKDMQNPEYVAGMEKKVKERSNKFMRERKGGTIPVELDSLAIMNIYGMAARKTIHLVPTGLKAYEIGVKLGENQPEAGRIVQEVALDFNGALSDNINGAWKKLGYKLYKNIMTSILGYKMSTVISQATSMVNTMTKLGPLQTIEAMTELMNNPALRDQVLNASSHLKTRVMELTLDAERGLQPSALRRGYGHFEDIAFKPLKAMDYAVAQVTWATAYRNAKQFQFMNEADARSYADEMTVNLQGSASRIDRSKLQRSLLGKMLTPFQTFTINQWNFMMSDVLGVDGVYKYSKGFSDYGEALAYKESLKKNERKAHEVMELEDGTAVVYRKDQVQNLYKKSSELAFLVVAGYLTGMVYDDYNERKPYYMPKITNPTYNPIGSARKALKEADPGDSLADNIGDASLAAVRDTGGMLPVAGSSIDYKADSWTGAISQTVTNTIADAQELRPSRIETYAPLAFSTARLATGLAGTDELKKFYDRHKQYQEKLEKDNKKSNGSFGQIKGFGELKPLKGFDSK